jgi:hypothetical protein
MVYWFTDEIRIRLFPAGVSFSTRVVCVQTDACAGKKKIQLRVFASSWQIIATKALRPKAKLSMQGFTDSTIL